MRITITQRLLAMVGFAVLILLVVGIDGIVVANSLEAKLHSVAANTIPSINTVNNIESGLYRERLFLRQHILSTDAKAMADVEKILKENEAKLQQDMDSYTKYISDAQDKELYDAVKSAIGSYVQSIAPILANSRDNQNEAARDQMIALAPVADKAVVAMDALTAYNQKLAADSEVAAKAAATRGSILSWTLMILGVFFVAGMGLLLVRAIGSSLHSMQETVVKIAETQDFTLRAAVVRQDEVGRTAAALNQLLDKMQTNLKAIASGARQVASASERLSSTADEVASAASQQSSAASSMAATVEEMTVSINHVGDRAAEANELSMESGRQASSGGKVIGQTVQDINEIAHTVEQAAGKLQELEAQTQKISSVIAVIKDVADQTNLLALNAAIEAARAGEQGRGFAVVADEVRKLAERTSVSTQEIATMINAIRTSAQSAVGGMSQSVARVGVGVERAQQANEAIQKIETGSRGAVTMVGEITSAIREQSSASNNIAAQVERIAQMAEESSASAHESAAAARDLDQLATQMQQIVASYRL